MDHVYIIENKGVFSYAQGVVVTCEMSYAHRDVLN